MARTVETVLVIMRLPVVAPISRHRARHLRGRRSAALLALKLAKFR